MAIDARCRVIRKVEGMQDEDAKAAQDAVDTASKGGTGRFTGYFATTTTKQPR